MYAVVFCALIQGVALISCGLISYGVKSGITFKTLLAKRHVPADTSEKPTVKYLNFDAPEGWDHACFLTEVTERKWAQECAYSWRVKLKCQPYTTLEEPSLSGWRPYIILLVDDSENMLASSGDLYNAEQLYRKDSSGYIVPAPERDDVERVLTLAGGEAYFRGDYGNATYPADNLYHFGGAMQCWTKAMSHLTTLIDDLDMCPIAVATVSGGIVQPFTADRKTLLSALHGIRPQGGEARLAETCLSLVTAFPANCGTSRHIVIASTGVAVGDGNLPSSIQDFDGDGNGNDTAIESAGCHCLDDVAAYALTRGVRVHAAGPADSGFLKDAARKGGGEFMPSKEAFSPPGAFIRQALSIYSAVKRFPTNQGLDFGPDWLGMEGASYLRLMANEPLHLGTVPAFAPKGTAGSLFLDGQVLLCTTSRDNLLSIDLPTGTCNWIISGLGGRVEAQSGRIIAGPGADGRIAVLGSTPEVRWTGRGDAFAVSPQSVCISDGSVIRAFALDTGEFLSQFSLDSRVRVLAYDPCREEVIAGSHSGQVYVLDQSLAQIRLVAPDLPGPLRAIRTFSVRKQPYLIALTENHAACADESGVIWRAELTSGSCVNAIVMDSKLYVSTWSPGECGGIDSGRSCIEIIDALTGKAMSPVSLFGSHAFGPFIDLESKTLGHASWDMSLSTTDLSDLAGVKPMSLGTMILQGR